MNSVRKEESSLTCVSLLRDNKYERLNKYLYTNHFT
jgi:hypothetical protein